jgi:hypothetical protein
MEEAPENGKESSLSAHANGMNEYTPKTELLNQIIKFKWKKFYLVNK